MDAIRGAEMPVKRGEIRREQQSLAAARDQGTRIKE
jgi:hypothetical protein